MTDQYNADNILNVIRELESRIARLEQRTVRVDRLDEFCDDLGEMRAGRFIAPSEGVDPEDDDFSGCFMSATGETFEDEVYHIGGVNTGRLMFGLRSTDGAGVFAGGAGSIDEDGINLNGIRYALSHYAEAADGSDPRYARMEMYIPDGDTIPALRISYFDATQSTELVTNGDFETGDLTGHSVTITAPDTFVCDTSSPHAGSYNAHAYLYQAGASPASRTAIIESSSGMSVTAGERYALQFYQKLVIDGVVIAPHKTTHAITARIDWYDSGSSLISSSTTFSNSYYYPGAAYFLVFGTGIAPAGAVTAKVYIRQVMSANFTGGGEWGSCHWYIDDISLMQVGVYRDLTFSPDLDYSEGLWPEGITKFFSECHLYDTSDAVKSLTVAFDNSYAYTGNIAFQSSPANGDYFICNIPLKAGTYTFRFSYQKSGNRGKLDAYLDGTKINSTTLDTYVSTTTMGVWTLTGVTVEKNGVHQLKLVVNGKNASSSNYFIVGEHITFSPEW